MTSRPYPAVVANHNQPAEPRILVSGGRKDLEGGPALWSGVFSRLGRPGSDLLSRVLRHSTIGAGELNYRVRNGIGWGIPARTTRSAKPTDKQQPIVCTIVED